MRGVPQLAGSKVGVSADILYRSCCPPHLRHNDTGGTVWRVMSYVLPELLRWEEKLQARQAWRY